MANNPTAQSGLAAHCDGCAAKAHVLGGHVGRTHAKCPRSPRGAWRQGEPVLVGARCDKCGAKAVRHVGRLGEEHVINLERKHGEVEVVCGGVWRQA